MFLIALYTAAFAADLTYAYTAGPFWAQAAYWLLVAGVAMCMLIVTAGLIDFNRARSAWSQLGGTAIAGGLSAVDLYLRYREGEEAGSHDYLWMSLVVFLLLLFNGWKGWEMVGSHHAGVQSH